MGLLSERLLHWRNGGTKPLWGRGWTAGWHVQHHESCIDGTLQPGRVLADIDDSVKGLAAAPVSCHHRLYPDARVRCNNLPPRPGHGVGHDTHHVLVAEVRETVE